jgi:hypothetical protein
MKKILFLFLLLLIPLRAYGLEIISAGFAAPPRITPEHPLVGGNLRIYTTLFNESSTDITGTVRLYEKDEVIGELSIALPTKSTMRYWFDTIASTTTLIFSAEFINVKKAELGKIATPVQAVSSTTKNSGQAATTSSTTTSSPKNNLITSVSSTSSTSSTSYLPATPLSSTIVSTTESLFSSSATKIATEKTKNAIETITAPLINFLDKKKHALEESIENVTTTEPIPILNKAATELENKTSFLKIPREKIPSFTHLYIWLISVGLYLLHTWWIMLLALLFLVYNIWKLWKKIRNEEHFD